MTLQVELVSPERIAFSGEADWVKCRTVGGGDIVFLTDHAPFIGALEIAEVQIRLADGRDVFAAVHGGFVEVSRNRVNILSDVAELATDIDLARARAALERATGDDPESILARRRAELRIRLASAVAP